MHPLFLAACLSAPRVSIEYTAPAMAPLLEVLALAGVLDGRRRLCSLELSAENPSDAGGAVRFRLCRRGEIARWAYLPEEQQQGRRRRRQGRGSSCPAEEGEKEENKNKGEEIRRGKERGDAVIEDDEDKDEQIEDLVQREGCVLFPWVVDKYTTSSTPDSAEEEDLGLSAEVRQRRRQLILQTQQALRQDEGSPAGAALASLLEDVKIRALDDVVILQVLGPSNSTTTMPVVDAQHHLHRLAAASGTRRRRRALQDPSRLAFQHPFASSLETPLRFGEDPVADVLLWCHGIRLHGAGYPANLPFEIVGIVCHGFCCEADG
ncbi:hypothetical protein BX600DRAFT_447021 [Xylariales sp. PMI_506]|nr:hypothetical protein BX600DRAFT_447021 [Xylariales sp. PMI_506]